MSKISTEIVGPEDVSELLDINKVATEEELSRMRDIGYTIAARPLMYLVMLTAVDRLGEGSVVVKKINDIITEAVASQANTGYLSLGNQDSEVFINLTLGLVPSDHVTETMVPDESYADDLYEKYNLLKQFALSCWDSLQSAYPNLMKLLKREIDSTDFTKLNISGTTLYFNENVGTRVGIVSFYTNKKGARIDL
jgi:hypothetical protein